MTARWSPRPLVAGAGGLPPKVTVYEVGPRDGLQAESAVVPTAVKAEFCRRLAAAGVRNLEVTSFVPPGVIPALADAEDLLTELDGDLGGVRTVCLIPNKRGLDRALAAGVTEVAVITSATESFARANLNTGRDAAARKAAEVTAAARRAGLAARGYVSMAFGDPWEGRVEPAAVAGIAADLHAAGCATISLGDTIGVATPGQIGTVIGALGAAGVPRESIALHGHDTYGQALANVHAALLAGVTEFDASTGGLGRCPYAPGATGNLATEDLVWMLHGLGIETGLDLDALVRTSAWMAERLRRPAVASRVATALLAAAADTDRPSGVLT
ncbi:hydroxymethylglutaryl-CoA lyase [Jiangella alkaliphila]|uniref:Hydroxymethylglutaryl-CoA lyase n=1 Tax=Jiangella alkaliphila TaxID=419479 RepID=A0A1H2KJ09_9ACTN|nr:hydroxymethylglutaryl-CoA lyase [Jiangella alkaliphila]SDU68700.1 hydroxymethylglutaryl-CoA lyase [Jiangella alkaliphila]